MSDVRAICHELRAEVTSGTTPWIRADRWSVLRLIEQVEIDASAIDRHAARAAELESLLDAAVRERDAERRRVTAVLRLCSEADEVLGNVGTPDVRAALSSG